MASMAGMFYIMAMYFYLKGRTENGSGKKLIYFTLCGVAAIFSFTSKENAAMLPMSLLLYDLFLIQGLNSKNFKNNLKIAIFLLLITFFIAILFVDISAIFEGYKNRPFTLFERLLTEPRIILFYLTLLFYPMSFRLTLLHDIEISRSLLNPWATLPAMLIIFLIIAIAITVSRKESLIAYCILFFFLNHIIEGSVIPLELIFEHRNYIPSMFVFVPIAILCVHILDHFSYRKSIQLVMSFVIIFLMAAQGHTTYIRNNLFKDGIVLWSDNIKKTINLHRPHHNLGDELIVAGFYEEGVSELRKSLNAKAAARISQKHKTHYVLGVYYLFNVEYDKALEHFHQTLKYIPNHPKTFNKIAIIKFYMNDLVLAEKFIKKALSLEPGSNEYHTTLSLILLKKGDVDKAIDEAKKGVKSKKNYLIGDAFRLKDNLTKSVYFFKRHLKLYPNQIPVNLGLIELYYLLKEKEALKQRVLRLMKLINEKELSEILLKFHNELNYLDYSRIERIICAIKNILDQQSDELNRIRKEHFQK
jgi:tetratricopeptide (TPR) repeat protein